MSGRFRWRCTRRESGCELIIRTKRITSPAPSGAGQEIAFAPMLARFAQSVGLPRSVVYYGYQRGIGLPQPAA